MDTSIARSVLNSATGVLENDEIIFSVLSREQKENYRSIDEGDPFFFLNVLKEKTKRENLSSTIHQHLTQHFKLSDAHDSRATQISDQYLLKMSQLEESHFQGRSEKSLNTEERRKLALERYRLQVEAEEEMARLLEQNPPLTPVLIIE